MKTILTLLILLITINANSQYVKATYFVSGKDTITSKYQIVKYPKNITQYEDCLKEISLKLKLARFRDYSEFYSFIILTQSISTNYTSYKNALRQYVKDCNLWIDNYVYYFKLTN